MDNTFFLLFCTLGVIAVVFFIVSQFVLFWKEIKTIDYKILHNWNKIEDTKAELEDKIKYQHKIIQAQNLRIFELEKPKKNDKDNKKD